MTILHTFVRMKELQLKKKIVEQKSYLCSDEEAALYHRFNLAFCD